MNGKLTLGKMTDRQLKKTQKKYNSKDKKNHKNAVYMDAGSTKVRIGSFLTADKESV
jgi:hypothetical protein